MTCSSWDASSSSNPLHEACFTTSQGGGANLALGENPTAGGWKGVGTNGGTSYAIFHMSYGLDPVFPTQEWMAAYAGVHAIASQMIAYGDTNDSLGFGFAVAQPYVTNPNGAINAAYTNAISNITDGNGCPGGASFGGGINGCGCNVIVSEGNTCTQAQTLQQGPWSSLQTDAAPYTAVYTNCYAYTVGCNYNINQYPL